MKQYEHRDFLNQKLCLGDVVCYIEPCSRKLNYGFIKKHTKTGVTIKYESYGKIKTCNHQPETVMKISEQLKVAKQENPELFI